MNLGQYLVQQLLEAEQTTIALFPGAFKPPHKGHFAVVKKLLENADQVVVLVSPKTREGITAEESIAVWELYKTLLDGSVEVRVASENPIRETYDVVKNSPDTNFIVAFGKNDADRFKQMGKNPNAKVFDAGNFDGANATGLRAALLSNNEDAIKEYLPEGIDIADFLMALSKTKKEEPPVEEPEAAPLKESKLNESETATIEEFIKYAIKNLGIQNPPRNLSLSYDTNKAKEMRSFGYFSPNDNKIWVYCGNRNMADILRTLAHELVHRKQDEDGRISYESGKTGSDIENEANAKAGVLLRDFGKQHEEIYQ
jgi:cytidyltransferase-like protein